jgi:uncharacterized protein
VKPHDPLKLDVERFATEQGRLAGDWPLGGMQRLVDACHVQTPPVDAERVAWQAVGERRRPYAAAEPQAWLQLMLDADVKLTCQRCLAPVDTPLRVERWFQFVAGEEQAAELDADSEVDVMASTRSLDLHQLAEDELLLALPLVPRHGVCPQPLLPSASPALLPDDAPPHPFAALAALKRAPH